MSTVLETIDGGTRYLEKRGIEDARRNMQMLVARQLGCTRMDLYLQFDRPLEEADLAPLRETLKKRGEGIPLQHLLGTVWFHKHEFKTDARALIPAPGNRGTRRVDSFLAAAGPPTRARHGLRLRRARPHARRRTSRLGCHARRCFPGRPRAGPGKRRAAGNHQRLVSRKRPVLRRAMASSMASSPISPTSRNPSAPPWPARSCTIRRSPCSAVPDGLDLIRRFIPDAFQRLKPGGWLVLEIGHDQASQVAGFLQASSFTAIEVKTDLSGVARFPFARRP